MAYLSARPMRPILTLAAGTGAAVMWIKVLAGQWPRLLLGASLCGGHAPILGHCPDCYIAAALTSLFIAGLGLSSWPARAQAGV